MKIHPTAYKLQINSSSFSLWHVHANMNFPYSSAFGCVTRCRTGIESPRSNRTTWGRLQIREWASKVFTVEWIEVALPLSHTNKSAVWKSGYALLCVRPPAYLARTPLNLSRGNKRENRSDILPKPSSRPFSSSPKLFDGRKGVKSPRRRLFTFAHEKPTIQPRYIYCIYLFSYIYIYPRKMIDFHMS